MCGRYYIEADYAEMAPLIREIENGSRVPQNLKTSGEIFPGDTVPAVCMSRSEHVRAFAMEWGFRLNGRWIINARIETAKEKPMFRESMESRRCLLPMNGYFEWEKRDGQRVKYYIAPEHGGLCCLAGLYRFEGDKPVFTVLTADAAENIAFIHPRMPVILPYGDREAWLYEAALPGQLKMGFARIGDEQTTMGI